MQIHDWLLVLEGPAGVFIASALLIAIGTYFGRRKAKPKRKRKAGSSGKIEPQESLYWVLAVLTLFLVAVGFYCAPLFWHTPMSASFGEDFTVGPGILLAVGAVIALSLKQVGAEELGGFYSFGRALKRARPGLQFVPLLTQLRKVSSLMQEFQFPEEPENVFKDDDKEALPPGMVRPIRMVTRPPNKDETGHLDAQMTLVINFVIQFQITDIFDFISNFGDIPYLVRQLRDVGETTLAEDITTMTAGGVVTQLPKINTHLFGEIQRRVETAGIKMRSARMISPDITHEVSGALADIPIKRAEAEQTRTTAAATRDRLTMEGQGTANARRQFLFAEAEGRKKMKEALDVSGETIIASETARDGLKEAEVIVVGAEGAKDFMGFAKAAQTALTPKPKAPATNTGAKS